MIKQKEIQKLLNKCKECRLTECIGCNITYTESQEIKEYIDCLESKLKQLGRGQHILMQSRRKWKNKYYKQRRKSRELQKSVEQIYDDYQDIGRMYFDLDEKVQAVKILCKQKYMDPVVEELTNTFFDMLSKGEENK